MPKQKPDQKGGDVTFTADGITLSKVQYIALQELAQSAKWTIGQVIAQLLDMSLEGMVDVWEELPSSRAETLRAMLARRS